MTNLSAIKLSGPEAFYNQPDYEARTKAEMLSDDPVKECHYRYETESKIIRVVKIIFAILIPLIGLYWGIHALIGKLIVPVIEKKSENESGTEPFQPRSLCELFSNFVNDWKYSKDVAKQKREDFYNQFKDSKFKFKRICVEVNGLKTDAMIVGTQETFGNGRWILNSNGNASEFERELVCSSDSPTLESSSGIGKKIMSLNASALLFNYPGKGFSEGFRERSTVTNAYRAMLNFVEDRQKGLAAKEVVLYGYSLGGVIQGEALDGHELKSGIKYVAVKRQAPADISSAARYMVGNWAEGAIKFFGWNISSINSSKNLKCPEIILQTADPQQKKLRKLAHKYQNEWNNHFDELPRYWPLINAQDVSGDGAIGKNAALANKLLADPAQRRPNQHILGMVELHTFPLIHWDQVSDIINHELSELGSGSFYEPSTITLRG